MKKPAILVACLLACFALFTGCTDPKGGDDQDANLNSGVEVDIPGEPNSADEPAGSGTSPGDVTSRPKDPKNSGGIAVTPKK